MGDFFCSWYDDMSSVLLFEHLVESLSLKKEDIPSDFYNRIDLSYAVDTFFKFCGNDGKVSKTDFFVNSATKLPYCDFLPVLKDYGYIVSRFFSNQELRSLDNDTIKKNPLLLEKTLLTFNSLINTSNKYIR